MKHMSGLDAFFLFGETHKQAMNLTGIAIYDPASRPDGKTPDHEEILRYARERVEKSHLFRRKVNFIPLNIDFPYWTSDEEFDVEHHVNRVSLPKPGNQQQLDEAIARIHGTLISRDHPLWEWWIIEGIDSVDNVPKGSFALAFKLHHAAFDGKAAWEVINAAHDLEAFEGKATWNTNPPPRLSSDEVRPSGAAIATQTVLRKMATPFKLTSTLLGAAPIAYAALRKGVRGFPMFSPRAPRIRFNQPLSNHRAHRSIRLPIAWLKEARTVANGATLNDVTLTILSGALSRYLSTHKELPDESLIVGVPIAIRSDVTKDSGGNEAILSLVPLATDIADPIERLKIITSWTSTKKNYAKDIPADKMIEFADYLPGYATTPAVQAATELAATRYTPTMFNTICTNVPASRVPLYLAGAKMVSYDASGPLWDGAGLIHVVTSYLDQLRISFDADKSQMPDADYYLDCIKSSIIEFAAAANLNSPLREETAPQKRKTKSSGAAPRKRVKTKS